ncbi:MAG: uncharacterized protein KVP18_002544 [Porospora cf. gigantea A]|uniref:uncharacterized protein n=1 Tax=Porospora cf. gigantea A TaxID=2853593 RepID=UPI00355A9C0F|nr:MAG: hypothetical protein KVP18_002544 [Porospora cf. gigantea A]
MQLFVTVGSTSFPELTARFEDSEFISYLRRTGFSHVVIQYGTAACPAPPPNLHFELFDFEEDVSARIAGADLVIAHGGAGTILEAAQLGARLVAVVNVALMDDHQRELVEALPFVVCCEVCDLQSAVDKALNRKSSNEAAKMMVTAENSFEQLKDMLCASLKTDIFE